MCWPLVSFCVTKASLPLARYMQLSARHVIGMLVILVTYSKETQSCFLHHLTSRKEEYYQLLPTMVGLEAT